VSLTSRIQSKCELNPKGAFVVDLLLKEYENDCFLVTLLNIHTHLQSGKPERRLQAGSTVILEPLEYGVLSYILSNGGVSH
jgi:hypothetical protein